MPTLSSLLVQHGVTSMRVVEEAIARQVLHGGDLATNVLELGAVHERELTVLLAESVGLSPAIGRLRPASPEVLTLIPVELAAKHSVFPLDLRPIANPSAASPPQPEDTLVIATAEPLAPAMAKELSFALGVGLRQLAAPLVRIRQALAQYYGLALDRRMQRLVKSLDAREREEASGSPAPSAEGAHMAASPPQAVTVRVPSVGADASNQIGQPSSSTPQASRQRSSSDIEDAPTVVASHSVETFDVDDTVPIAMPMGQPLPKPGDPALLGIDDAPTVEIRGYPFEPQPTPQHEPSRLHGERTPRVEELASRLAALAPAHDEAHAPAAALSAESEAARVEGEELASPDRESDPRTARIVDGVERPDEDAVAGAPADVPDAAEAAARVENEDALAADASSDGASLPPPSSDAAPRRVAPGRALPGWLLRTAGMQRGNEGPTPGHDDPSGPAPGASPSRGAHTQAAQQRKGPFTLAMAERELADVDSSEAVLTVVFTFARQYFEYTVLFTVHGERAEGRNAFGPGAERERVTAVSVPLDAPNLLVRARALRAPLIAPWAAGAFDSKLQRELDRVCPPGVDVAVVPIVVRGRVVALIYGDDGAAPVELSNIGDLIALSGVAATVLERLILRKKLNRGGSPTQAEAGPAPAQRAPVEPATPLNVREKDGPLSVRTRAALLSLRSLTGDAAPSLPGAGPDPSDVRSAAPAPDAMDAAPDQLGEVALPPASASEGAGIDAVAKAFGLRGTEAEGEPLRLDGRLPPPGTERDGSVPPLVAPVLEGRSSTPPLVVDRPALVGPGDVSGTAATAPMMPAVVGEIPDLEVPMRVSTATGPLLDEPDALGTRLARPVRADDWADPPSDVHREVWAAPGSAHPTRRRTPPGSAGRGDATSSRPGMERRAGVSPLPGLDPRAEYATLVQQVIDGDEAGNGALAELVRNGETAIPLIAARFPGPLRIDRQRLREQLLAQEGDGAWSLEAVAGRSGLPDITPASQCGPILELIVAIRRPSLPFMTVRSASPDPEVRFWATHVLGELPYPEAANALLPRLFDDNASVRKIARCSAASLISTPLAGAPLLQALDHITRTREESTARRLVAIETIAEIRAGALIPGLIGALGDPHDAIVDASAKALGVIAREDFGRDIRRWGAWWVRNGDRHRIEWLIDALTHENHAIRRAASEELKAITQEYFGYYDDLSRPEREAAQERYRAWWIAEGRSRFRGAVQ